MLNQTGRTSIPENNIYANWLNRRDSILINPRHGKRSHGVPSSILPPRYFGNIKGKMI